MARHPHAHHRRSRLRHSASLSHRLVFRRPHPGVGADLLSRAHRPHRQQLHRTSRDKQSHLAMARHHARLRPHPTLGPPLCLYGITLLPPHRTRLVCHAHRSAGRRRRPTDDPPSHRRPHRGVGRAFLCPRNSQLGRQDLSIPSRLQPLQNPRERRQSLHLWLHQCRLPQLRKQLRVQHLLL